MAKKNKHRKPSLLNVAQAAAMLDVSTEQVREWLADGTLPPARIVRDQRGQRDYLIDQAALQEDGFIAAVTEQITHFRGRNGGAGKKVTNAQARHERSHNDEQLRHIQAAAPTPQIALLLRAGYWLMLLNPLARSRWNTIERERLFTMQDRLLAAIYRQHQSDHWWLLGSGGLEITLTNTGADDSSNAAVIILARLKLDEEYGSSSEYLSYTIEYAKFRYQFYLPYVQATAWLEPLTIMRLPQQDTPSDSPLLGYAAAWEQHSGFSEAEIVDHLAVIYGELNGGSRAEFTSFVAAPQIRRPRRRDDYGFGDPTGWWDDNEQLEYLLAFNLLQCIQTFFQRTLKADRLPFAPILEAERIAAVPLVVGEDAYPLHIVAKLRLSMRDD